MTGGKESLWNAFDAAHATGGTVVGNWHATGVSIDSRTLQLGDLFVALQGPKYDGHDFVLDALKRGASASIVSHRPEGVSMSAPLLEVSDTLVGLNRLGIAGRTRANGCIIAVTGSVGKTSVKEALAGLLGRQGTVSYSLGSLNNHYGVPLSLARLPENSEFGVFELGMNHAGELKNLSCMVRPMVAVVTTVEVAHLENFDSVGDIALAKAEIFAGLQNGGVAILNKDNHQFEILKNAAMSAEAKIVTFGAHQEADFRLTSYELGPQGSLVHACFGEVELTYRLKLLGYHWIQNSLAILAAAHSVGADVFEAARTFGSINPPKGRGQRHRIRTNSIEFELIDDSYNASPVSILAALEVLSQLGGEASGRRIAVLGDMLELGPESSPLHLSLTHKVIENEIDLVYATGPNMRDMFEELPSEKRAHWSENSEELLSVLVSELQQDDVILIKGSLGVRMGVIVDGLMALDVDG